MLCWYSALFWYCWTPHFEISQAMSVMNHRVQSGPNPTISDGLLTPQSCPPDRPIIQHHSTLTQKDKIGIFMNPKHGGPGSRGSAGTGEARSQEWRSSAVGNMHTQKRGFNSCFTADQRRESGEHRGHQRLFSWHEGRGCWAAPQQMYRIYLLGFVADLGTTRKRLSFFFFYKCLQR